MKRKFITIIVLLVIWQGFALSIDKVVILPLPLTVFKQMITFVSSKSFYLAILATLLRVFISFLLALIIGTILGIFSGLSKKVNDYLYPIISLMQTIPQIAYILILLVWFKSLTALIVIVLLMISPILILVYIAVNIPISLISSDFIHIFSSFFISFSLNTCNSVFSELGIVIKSNLKFVLYFLSANFNIDFNTNTISLTVLFDKFFLNCL